VQAARQIQTDLDTSRILALASNATGVFSGIVVLGLLSFVWDQPYEFGPVHPMAVLLNPVHLLPLYVVNLLAIRARCTRGPNAFTDAWALCLLWLASLAYLLTLGQWLTAFGLTRSDPDVSPLHLALALLPTFACVVSLRALGVHRVFRPRRWVSLIAVPLIVALSLMTVSERFSDGLIGVFRGPAPDDFGGSLSWSIDNNDLIELMELAIGWFLIAWTIYLGHGALRASRIDAARSAPIVGAHRGREQSTSAER